MPTDPQLQNYDDSELVDTIAEIERILNTSKFHDVLFGGDFNYDESRNTRNQKNAEAMAESRSQEDEVTRNIRNEKNAKQMHQKRHTLDPKSKAERQAEINAKQKEKRREAPTAAQKAFKGFQRLQKI